MDYIYAILHHPTYRLLYAEFLKIDFPRIPFVENEELFEALSEQGTKLRKLHLMIDITPQGLGYPISGSNEVEKIIFSDSKVWINSTQYFDGVSQTAREFYIGGYQPAQKRLKDRKGSKLSAQDIMHYMKICTVLVQTDELVSELEKIDVF